ncbi:MAG: hypothetical protein JRG70_18200 [Deltaproteobacteria bacterium]|nr:hypothetical protein [Deltaproteobacteria bacterium]
MDARRVDHRRKVGLAILEFCQHYGPLREVRREQGPLLRAEGAQPRDRGVYFARLALGQCRGAPRREDDQNCKKSPHAVWTTSLAESSIPRQNGLQQDFAVRAKSKWTPGGIVLWLIAAAIASLIVWSQSRPASAPPPSIDDVEVEVEFIE